MSNVLTELVEQGFAAAPPTALRIVTVLDLVEWSRRRAALWSYDHPAFGRALHQWVESLPPPPPGVAVTTVSYRPSEPAAVAETREAAE
jgi:hypothetical protein